MFRWQSDIFWLVSMVRWLASRVRWFALSMASMRVWTWSSFGTEVGERSVVEGPAVVVVCSSTEMLICGGSGEDVSLDCMPSDISPSLGSIGVPGLEAPKSDFLGLGEPEGMMGRGAGRSSVSTYSRSGDEVSGDTDMLEEELGLVVALWREYGMVNIGLEVVCRE